jgi:hypothetical protein
MRRIDMARKVTQVLLIAEFESHLEDREIRAQLDQFREAVQPGFVHGICLYRATALPVHLFDLSTRGGPERMIPPRRFETEE